VTLEDRLAEHMEERQAEAVAEVLRMGAAYGEGDALAGMKLTAVDPAQWRRLTELLAETGYDGEMAGRMDAVSFINDPKTDDEKLNAEIRCL